jgi:hypothetical protein
MTFPRCSVVGCDEQIDPRYMMHAHGRVVATCDAHGLVCSGDSAETCTCPSAKASEECAPSPWYEALNRRKSA